MSGTDFNNGASPFGRIAMKGTPQACAALKSVSASPKKRHFFGDNAWRCSNLLRCSFLGLGAPQTSTKYFDQLRRLTISRISSVGVPETIKQGTFLRQVLRKFSAPGMAGADTTFSTMMCAKALHKSASFSSVIGLFKKCR